MSYETMQGLSIIFLLFSIVMALGDERYHENVCDDLSKMFPGFASIIFILSLLWLGLATGSIMQGVHYV